MNEFPYWIWIHFLNFDVLYVHSSEVSVLLMFEMRQVY